MATPRRFLVVPALALLVLVLIVFRGNASQLPGPDKWRPFAPRIEGKAVLAGVAYGPHRRGQRPGAREPSEAEILEDLHILARHWGMIRIYGSTGPAEPILRLIRTHEIPLTVMLGAWIEPEGDEPRRLRNDEQIAEAIRLANAYADVVCAVSVGNESQVYWSAHRTPPAVLIRYLRAVRAGVTQPVTTADDYNFWNKPESHAVAREVDFIVVHAYAMWNRQRLEDAVAWTRRTVESIQAEHAGRTVVLGETGWATERNPEASGDEAERIIGRAGEEQQRSFYESFTNWARSAALPYFYFEAFDEPWKGGSDPRSVEKHWGLFDVDRKPKLAMRAAAQQH